MTSPQSITKKQTKEEFYKQTDDLIKSLQDNKEKIIGFTHQADMSNPSMGGRIITIRLDLEDQIKRKDEIEQNQKIVDELKKINSIVLPHDISPDDARFIRYDYVRNLIKETTGKDIKDLN